MLRLRNLVGALLLGLLLFGFYGCSGKDDSSTGEVYPEIEKLIIVPIEGKVPLDVTFEVVLKNSSSGECSISWDFDGDGNPDLETSLEETIAKWHYDEPGNYTVKVGILKDGRVVSQREGLVRVKENIPPDITYFQVTPVQGRIPLRVVVRLGAEDPDPLPGSNGIAKTEFDMDGDGEPDVSGDGLLDTITYFYDTPGIYRVTARVYDDDGGVAMAGPVTVSAFLPPPVIENPETQVWHAGGGWSYSITFTVDNTMLLADGYEGLKIFKYSFFPLKVTLVGTRLSYLDAQVLQVDRDDDYVFALLDDSNGIYAAPISRGEPGSFTQVIGGNIPFFRRFYYNDVEYRAGVNETTYSLILVGVENGLIDKPISYSLQYYIDWLQNNGAPAECTIPDLTDILQTGNHLLFIMKKCVWELDLDRILAGEYSSAYLHYALVPVPDTREMGNAIWLDGKLLIESNYGVEIFDYYPGTTTLITLRGEIASGYVAPSLLPNTFFGVYSRDATTVTLLQSIGESKNVFYTVRITDLTLIGTKWISFVGTIKDFRRLPDYNFMAVGEDGIVMERNRWETTGMFRVNDHLKGFGISEIDGEKLLFTTSAYSGYTVYNLDDFTYPRFLFNHADYTTSYDEISIDGEYGWMITQSGGRAYVNRIRLLSQSPYLQILWSRQIADMNNGELYSFFPLDTSDVVGLKINRGYEIYSTVVSADSAGKPLVPLYVESNDMMLMNEVLFTSDPMASIYFFDLNRVYEGYTDYLGYFNLNISGRIVTPMALGGIEDNGSQIVLVGGGNRKLYGFTYDPEVHTLLLRDGYPLFSDTSLYSSDTVFTEIRTLGPYAFVSMSKGGFAIVNALDAGILSYEDSLLVVGVLVYPDFSGDVRLITRGYYSKLSNVDAPDLIRLIDVTGLKYQP